MVMTRTGPSSQEVAMHVGSCNLKADLDLEKFDPTLHIMIEFLKSHPIHKPLTKSIEFPLSIIHKAYSTAVYNSEEDYIEFNINKDKTTKLSKVEFLEAIGLPESKEKKTLYEPTNEEIFDVFDQMGYLPPKLESFSNFRKGKLPGMWHFLFHIILRCLSGRVAGTDMLSRQLLVLIFGMYTGKEVDFGTTIWSDFTSYVFPKKKAIPCARFWALALQSVYNKLKIPLPKEEEMFTPRALSRHTIPNQSAFVKVARLPEAMLQYIEKNSKVLIRHIEETGPPEPELPTQPSQHTSSPTKQKKNALKVKKTTGKRKGDTIPSPQAKRQPTKSQKVKDAEKRSTVGSQSSTSSSTHEDDVSQKHWNITHTQPPSSQKEDVSVEKSHDLINNDESIQGLEKNASEKEQVATNQLQQVLSELREAGEKKEEERMELVGMLLEEQQQREEEDRVPTTDKLIELAIHCEESLDPFTKTGMESAQDMEKDFVFAADDGLIQDSDSHSIMETIKPSKSTLFLATSETESQELPKRDTSTLPTTTVRRTKLKKKKKSKYVSRVEFNSLNQKLSEVLELVNKIPPSKEKFVNKEEFVEMQKVVTSLAQRVPNLETREKTLRESIVKSTADALKKMEQKRTNDTFKYLDRMDEMLKMVKEIQQSYDHLTNTVGHQHGDEIVRLSEQLCDYRNKNIILQAVLVKVIQSAQQLLRPRNVRFDEILFAIQKIQNSVDVLPKTLSNEELSKQVPQSFQKVFDLIENLKGSKSVVEAGEDENVVITETSPSPKIDEVSRRQPPPKTTIPPPSPPTSFVMPPTQIALMLPETQKASSKGKGKRPLEVPEVSRNQMKSFRVSEEDKKHEVAAAHFFQANSSKEEQHALSPLVYVIKQLKDDELVPKQTAAPPASDEYQWDIPMSPNARYYSVFPPLHPHLSREMQIPIELNRLEEFFKAHAQPPKDVWSLRRIIRVVGYKKRSFQKEDYFSFEVVRSDNKKYFFSEADFPNLNPNDLYMIAKHFQTKLLTHQPSRFPFLQIQRFLRSLTYDLGSIDAERFDSFVDNPPKEMNQYLEGIENRHRGPTEDPELGIIFSNEKDSPRLFFRLNQKHLCTTKFLEKMINLTLRSNASAALKVKIIEELEWWVAVHSWPRLEDIQHQMASRKCTCSCWMRIEYCIQSRWW
ncbi:unnamed protein product [Lactuca saligna]|uniref:Uncharacterized protein n=1 Tax=Lactuca saligna TaxID=75948 RepID=A0AA35ZPJ2_LACSI|nr:unnamed protein product [Lactuca saligna]